MVRIYTYIGRNDSTSIGVGAVAVSGGTKPGLHVRKTGRIPTSLASINYYIDRCRSRQEGYGVEQMSNSKGPAVKRDSVLSGFL